MKRPDIVEVPALVHQLRSRRRDGQRITLVHGVFDDAERIDRALLRGVRASSDVIVATVPKDHTLVAPRVPERDRIALAASIPEIDFVVPVHWASAAMPITVLEPDVYAF